MVRKLLSFILIESFLFTALGQEFVWAQQDAIPFSMLLRAQSAASDGGTREDLINSLRETEFPEPEAAQDGGNRLLKALDLNPQDKRRLRLWWGKEKETL
ncbi:MAG: hypothetical protein ABH845_03825, partial [Candidatus Omnitrophota bacterium]